MARTATMFTDRDQNTNDECLVTAHASKVMIVV